MSSPLSSKKVFLTGSSGLFGCNALASSPKGWTFIPAIHSRQLAVAHAPGAAPPVTIDLTDFKAVRSCLLELKPDAIVHAAANADIDSCETDRPRATLLNTEVPRQLARIASEIGAQFVFFSSDAIFECAPGSLQRPFTESDTPTPVNFYGETKLQAEKAILAECPKALILRTNFYGWGPSYRPSFSDWILNNLTQGREIPLFNDVYFSSLDAHTLTQIIFELLDRDLGGLFHVTSDEGISKYEFARRLAQVFELNPAGLRPVPVKDVALKARRSNYMVLSPQKLKDALPHISLSFKHGMERLREDGTTDYARMIKGSIDNFPFAVR